MCMSQPRRNPRIGTIMVVDLCWRFGPEPTVARASIGLEPNWGIKKNGICQMVTPTAISAVAASRVRVVGSLGWASAEACLLGELGVEGVDNVDRDRHRQAVPDAELGDVRGGAPKALFSPIEPWVTVNSSRSIR
jgi:hypothetical protein